MINIIIVDDHPVVRRGLVKIIDEEPDMQVVGEAENALTAFEIIRRTECDVVVLDIALPGMSGLDVMRQLKHEYEKLPLLILSVYPEEQYAVRVIKAGASGYLTQDTAPGELVKALRRVASGRKYISASLAEKLADDLEPSDKPPHENLSNREYQILCMIAGGQSLKGIADKLCISEKTVSTYRGRILEKMKKSTNADLTRYAIDHHLV
jgi:DNA-binding NarL/FixJ family response regulator